MSDRLLSPVESGWIRERARALGFADCGVARAERFPELDNFSEWLDRGYGGEMKYLEDPRRRDPRRPMPGARSLIVCALNYNVEQPYSTECKTDVDDSASPRGWISRYAWGEDYHEVLWEKLNKLAAEMHARFPQPFEVRAYADTGPLHERAAAKYAGLGWLGKNTLLISQSLGSWLFLGVILTSLPLTPTLGTADTPPPDRCGSCRRCLDACPTQAIVEPYLLDASRCISYLTIELRGSIPEEFREPMGRHIFGCDICQDVCPWNRKAPASVAPEFEARPGLVNPALAWLAEMTVEEFRQAFRGSPIRRTKRSGLRRNAAIAMGNSGNPEFLPLLEKLAVDEDESVAESARWAKQRLSTTG